MNTLILHLKARRRARLNAKIYQLRRCLDHLRNILNKGFISLNNWGGGVSIGKGCLLLRNSSPKSKILNLPLNGSFVSEDTKNIFYLYNFNFNMTKIFSTSVS